jgi:hypothetical protein
MTFHAIRQPQPRETQMKKSAPTKNEKTRVQTHKIHQTIAATRQTAAR